MVGTTSRSVPLGSEGGWIRRLIACSGLFALTACGGGDEAETAAHREALAGSEAVISPLMDNDGSVMPSDPRAVPRDPGAWTRNGRYAHERQAAQLERALGDRALSIQVRCCGIDGAQFAVLTTYGLQAAYNLPADAPVLVRSADLRQGAWVVNQLGQNGYANVWLVTQ
jgi:hypothetical protein